MANSPTADIYWDEVDDISTLQHFGPESLEITLTSRRQPGGVGKEGHMSDTPRLLLDCRLILSRSDLRCH